jgi:serine/threonine-protein kinase
MIAPGAPAPSVPAPSGSAPSRITPSGLTPSGALISLSGSIPPGSGDRLILAHRYEILALLGAGGMGTVYRARDVELEEIVALKVLRRELLDTPGILERFRREAKLARRVTHRNVARVFDIGEHDGEKFLTMEFVDGESLSATLAREGALAVPRAVEIASAIAAGLGSAHAAGVVHRDLKPDNVLLTRDGRVVITDFGIARAFAGAGGAANTMGSLLGTPAYMAPEQVEGRSDVDARADIYALGALLFELVTGRRAWQGESPFALAAARLIKPPPDPRSIKPDLPTACAELIVRCMAQKPGDRPATVEEVASAMSALTLPAPPRVPPLASPTLAVLPAVPDTRPGDKTVAVLPFRNAGAPDDDYLAEELTDDLIDALSMTRGLKVRSRGAVARFRDKDPDPRDVGRELGVQVVVEGSVRKARGHVRISARLVSVTDGFQLWAKRFDRPEQEVLSINDEAARAIAEALTLDAGQRAREAPSDPVAIDLYIRARHEYRKFWPDHVKRSIELFEQAAAIAPSDPTILSGMAIALARLVFFVGDRGIDRARAVAERAVAVAPDLGEARLALGAVLFQMGDARGAARELRQAVGKSPGLAEAHASLGRLLAEVGAFDEGIRRLEAAVALDPDVPLARPELVRALALQGRWDESDALAASLKDPSGAFGFWTMRARLALWRGRPEVAEAHLRALGDDVPMMSLPRIVLEVITKHKVPEHALGLDVVSQDADGGLRRRAFFFQIHAELSAHLGDQEIAFDAARRAVDVGLIDLAWLERCPLLERVRQDPRYPAIHAQMRRRADEILEAYRTL